MAEQSGGTTSQRYVVAGGTDAWAEEAASRGRRGSQQLLDVGIEKPSTAVRSALRLADGEMVVARSRLMLFDDSPVEVATSYFPASFAAETALAGSAKIRGGAIAVLASLGRAPVDVAEYVTARLPEPEERAALRISETEPLLVLTRLNTDGEGRVVELAVNRMVARLNGPITYRLRVPG